MLDPSVVLSKGLSQGTIVLSPAAPDRIIDGGAAGATAKVISGPVLTAEISNAFVPSTAWAPVAAGASVAVGASKRVAVRDGGGPGGSVLAEPVWA